MFILPKKRKGMTFVELIIVVAIVNILIVVSQPSYVFYVQETHADNVKLQMFQIAEDLERIKGRYYTYEAALDSDDKLITGDFLLSYPINNEDDKRFDITITNLSFNTFKIEAIPTEMQGDYGIISLSQLAGDLEGHYHKDGLLIEEWY